MNDIAFDDGVAVEVIRAAESAAEELRGQGAARRAAAEDAHTDYSGSYADRFTEAVQTEAQDRPILARALCDLADAVRVVRAEASKERERLADVAAWEQHEEDRRRAELLAASSTVAVPAPSVPDVMRVRPSTVPIRPTAIHARFAPRGRVRTGSGTGGGRSSADPPRLRSFSSTCRANDAAAAARAATLRSSWGCFVDSCAWARVGSVTVIDGFDRYLDENTADAAWTDRVADAFERAGGGSLPNTLLHVEDGANLLAAFRQLFERDLDAAAVAERWASMGYTRSDQRALAALPMSALQRLGNLEGVPYWARSTANEVVLDQRLAELQARWEQRARLGAPREQLEELAGDLNALTSVHDAMVQGSRDGARSLISLTADHPPLAAIAIGDVDAAENVTWAVPGMNSSTAKMTDWVDAAQNVYDRQGTVDKAGGDRAVIGWMGYKTPPIPTKGDMGVFHSEYARAGGGDNLADALRGLDAVRGEDGHRTNVLAHSYGTTTATFGLTQDGIHVDSLTTVASAGLPDFVDDAGDIHAEHVYSGQARNVLPQEWGHGDPLAIVGRNLSSDHHVDPTDPDFNATTFGVDGTVDAEGGPLLTGVKDHGVHTTAGNGYLDPNTESLQNVALATTGQGDAVSPYLPKGPTPVEIFSGAPGGLASR